MKRTDLTFRIPRRLYKPMRDLLGSEALWRESIRWHESAYGFWSKTFTITGSLPDVNAVGDRVNVWLSGDQQLRTM